MVTIMFDYDALKNGHARGHNLIATSVLVAAGLAGVMKEILGHIFVIETPDEERGSLDRGKIALLEGNHFKLSRTRLLNKF
jgi:metal-dependent amidase/aminoacylase/carboxypeptidase family protein